MKRKKNDLEINQVSTTLAVFLEAYNKSVPAHFPKASLKSLKQFQALNAGLFRKGDEWSIDKHRKRLMDWLPSHTTEA